MAPTLSSKKRKVQDGINGRVTRPKKKFKKQSAYHSSSEDEDEDAGDDVDDFAPVNLLDSDVEEDVPKAMGDRSNKSATKHRDLATKPVGGRLEPTGQERPKSSRQDEEDDEDDGADDDDDNANSDIDEDEVSAEDDEFSLDGEEAGTKSRKRIPKRNDPSVFSTSISKILSTKLPTSARADPVLSRSKSAAQTTSDLANEKLEQRARAKLRADKKEEQDRGHIRDVLGVERGEAGETAEEEKRLRKIAQRGVVKLFNAVRAAQVRGEDAAREERKKGTIGMEERKKAVNEVSKQGFLELINGKKGKPLNIEEA
jgi:hypothetical protein